MIFAGITDTGFIDVDLDKVDSGNVYSYVPFSMLMAVSEISSPISFNILLVGAIAQAVKMADLDERQIAPGRQGGDDPNENILTRSEITIHRHSNMNKH